MHTYRKCACLSRLCQCLKELLTQFLRCNFPSLHKFETSNNFAKHWQLSDSEDNKISNILAVFKLYSRCSIKQLQLHSIMNWLSACLKMMAFNYKVECDDMLCFLIFWWRLCLLQYLPRIIIVTSFILHIIIAFCILH